MSEVRVKIGADIRDLQKGVRDAQKELGTMASSAREAAGGLGSTAKSIEQIKKEARDAIKESQKFRQSLDEAAQAGSFAGEVFKGIFTAAIVQRLAGEIKDKLVGALTSATQAARETERQFAGLYAQLSDFSKLSGTVRVFENRDQILAEGKRIQDQIAGIDRQIEALGGDSRRAGFELFGIDIEQLDEAGRKIRGLFSEQQRTNNTQIEAIKRQRAELEGSLSTIRAQLESIDNAGRLDAQRAQSNLRTRQELEAQADAIRDQIAAQQQLLKLQAQAFVAVPGPPKPLGSGDTRKPPKPQDFGVDPTQFQIFPNALKDDGAVQAILDAQARLNAQLAEGRDRFTELGVEGAAALADVALGFEKLADLGNIVADITKNLVRDLALAAARAALVSAFFPGAGAAAGGFKGLLGNFLGIPKLAAGGIVTKPTLSLIGEAGPEAVVPLSKLSQAGGQREVHIPSVTIRGGDLVIAFQQARQQTARSVGNIPLR